MSNTDKSTDGGSAQDDSAINRTDDGLSPADVLEVAQEGDEVRLEFDILPPAAAGYMGNYTLLANVEEVRVTEETDRIQRRKLVLSGSSKKFLRLDLEVLTDTDSRMNNVCRQIKYAGETHQRLTTSGIDILSAEVEPA